MFSEGREPARCPHGTVGDCEACRFDASFLRDPSSVPELVGPPFDELSSADRNTLMVLRRGDFVARAAGAGIFDTGSTRDLEDARLRERRMAGTVVSLMQARQIDPSIVFIDDVLTQPTFLSVVDRIQHIGQSTGVRNNRGQARGIVVTGFLHSRYLTPDGLEQVVEMATQDRAALEPYLAIAQSFQGQDGARSVLGALPEADRPLVAAILLARQYRGDWQSLSGRTNGSAREEDTIVTVTVAPHLAFQAIFAVQSHTTRPISAENDPSYRWAGFMSNYNEVETAMRGTSV